MLYHQVHGKVCEVVTLTLCLSLACKSGLIERRHITPTGIPAHHWLRTSIVADFSYFSSALDKLLNDLLHSRSLLQRRSHETQHFLQYIVTSLRATVIPALVSW